MSLQFHRVALVGKYQDAASGAVADSTRDVIADVAGFLTEQGCDVVLAERTAEATGLRDHPALDVAGLRAACDLAGVVGGMAVLCVGAWALLNSAVALANLTGTIQAQWAATLISFGLSLPLLVEVFDHPLGSAWKRFAEKCRIYPPQALPMQVLNSAILSITLVLPVSSLMYRRRLPVGEQFRQYDIPFCVLMALILLLPPLVKKRLYRWQGRVCLILYVMYLAAVLIMPRAGA